MIELRQLISEINALEARNRQYKIRERLGYELPADYRHNELKLEGLYRRKSELIAQVDVSEPQFIL